MVMPDINPSVSKHEKSLQIPLAQNWRMAMIPTFQVVIKHQDDQLEEICDSSTELWPYDFREKKNGNSSQPCVSTKGSVVLTPFFLAIYIYIQADALTYPIHLVVAPSARHTELPQGKQ